MEETCESSVDALGSSLVDLADGSEEKGEAQREESNATNESTAVGFCSALEESMEDAEPSASASPSLLGEPLYITRGVPSFALRTGASRRRWICGRRRVGRLFIIYAKSGVEEGETEALWVLGPHWRFSVAMLFAMLGLEFLFLSTLQSAIQTHLFICASQMGLAALTICFFFLTVFKDPGLPKALRQNYLSQPGEVCLSRSVSADSGNQTEFWMERSSDISQSSNSRTPTPDSPGQLFLPTRKDTLELADLEAQHSDPTASARDSTTKSPEMQNQKQSQKQVEKERGREDKGNTDIEANDEKQTDSRPPHFEIFKSGSFQEAVAHGRDDGSSWLRDGNAECLSVEVFEKQTRNCFSSPEISTENESRSSVIARRGQRRMRTVSRASAALALKRQLIRRLQDEDSHVRDDRSRSPLTSASELSDGFCEECGVRCLGDDVQHCEDCGVCVEGLDHHCPWTSKCVGRKNVVDFYAWVCSGLAAVLVYGIAASSLSLRDPPNS